MSENSKIEYNFPYIIAQFKIDGRISEIGPYGSGYIHDTFRAKNAQLGSPDYLLQRMNHNVFKNIPVLMENVERVTNHLKKKLESIPGSNPEKEVLTLVPLKNNEMYFIDEEGNYWRMYYFLEGTKSYNLVTSPYQAFEGGKAFGKFQSLLADLDLANLHETIPRFHDVESRLSIFWEAAGKDVKGRVKEIQPETTFIKERSETMGEISRLGRKGKIPIRITHNDTKFNNVLLDQNDKAQCVIDLDTVMPGYVAYDFGDAIRTTVNNAPEDEKDIERITVNLALFQAFAQGFLQETREIISEEEVKSLFSGVLLLPFIMGLRFLTDYIEGDNYFKIHFAGHNLQRARAQFALVKKLEAEQDVLKKIIDAAAGENVEQVEMK